jgi:hypothetical protein
MKTISASILALLLSINLNAGNSNGNPADKIKPSLTIPESMKREASRHPDGQKVLICFVVNEKGDVIEVSDRCKDAEARRNLEAQFIRLNFKDLAPCIMHEIEINFVMY